MFLHKLCLCFRHLGQMIFPLTSSYLCYTCMYSISHIPLHELLRVSLHRFCGCSPSLKQVGFVTVCASLNSLYMLMEVHGRHGNRALGFLRMCARAFDCVPVLAWLAHVYFQYKGGVNVVWAVQMGPRTSTSMRLKYLDFTKIINPCGKRSSLVNTL